MKSELLLQYLGYLAIALFCGYFIYIVLKVQSDYMFDSVAGVESFIGGTVIEGMQVTELEKKNFETGTQHLDIAMDSLDKDYFAKQKEYLNGIPQDTKDSILELYDLFIEAVGVELITKQARAIGGLKSAKNAMAFLGPFDKAFMHKLRENEDLRDKVLELLGRKK
uniref:Uncharacterized protein n=1 Tax=viral metagenome TaxID=1070528 RepID=A0A6C0C2D2_9ZZZZ